MQIYYLKLQFDLSSSKWPSEDYELKVAEKINMTYKGPISYRGFVNNFLVDSTKDWVNQAAPIKEDIASNFLKVREGMTQRSQRSWKPK